LFSFGSVLYTLCTGTIPFDAPSTTGVLTALAIHDPRPVHEVNPTIPRALSDLVSQLLEKRPQDRPASAEAVLERLRQIEKGEPAVTPTKKRAPARPAADPDPTIELAAAKEPAPGFGWAKLALAGMLVAGVAFAVPMVITPALRHRAAGTSSGDKGGKSWVNLSSLQRIHQENWPFLPPSPKGGKGEKGPPPGSGEVRVKGRKSLNGIFMHPPPHWEGTAYVTYRLRGEFETFQAEVSLNDGPPQSESPFTFAVYGDGALLWKSRPVSRQADQQTCSVSVRGVDQLKLEAQSAGDPRGAHAVWVEPSLSK
jgi:serine/threonine protein kinase